MRAACLPPLPFQIPSGNYFALQLWLTGWSTKKAPQLTRGTTRRPSLPQRPARLPERPATSSLSLRGTRKGNVVLRLVSLRRGHPLPSLVAGTNSPWVTGELKVEFHGSGLPVTLEREDDHPKSEPPC